jgi:hypothetical protein
MQNFVNLCFSSIFFFYYQLTPGEHFRIKRASGDLERAPPLRKNVGGYPA